MPSRRRDDLALELFRPLAPVDAVAVRLLRHAVAAAILLSAAVFLYSAYVAAGYVTAMVREPVVNGATTAVAGLWAPVTIVRDGRDVPHLNARSEHDLFEAQGFVEATDRLFQMELTRRYAYGRLAEVLGAKALALDESQRYYDIAGASEREWQRLDPRDRAALRAFSDGVNAAMKTQPLPIEFRLLLYRPQPWRPQDCVAVSLAVSDALADSWHDVLARDEVWRRVGSPAFAQYFPLSDPAYDVSPSGTMLHGTTPLVPIPRVVAEARSPVRPGSNAWAAGALRSSDGDALLANDPHLDLTIPGLWYVIDLQAPGFHAAGASIPGAPGILLGHDERVAWGATNGDVASESLFAGGRLDARRWVRERFGVRFARDVERSYYRAPDGFGVSDPGTGAPVLVRPAPCTGDCSGIVTFLALDRARSVEEALRVLARYGGAAENFVLADARGSVAYHLAGRAVNDPAWGRYVHPAADRARFYPAIPFDRLPGNRATRTGIAITANNKMYGSEYPYRLAASFDPPYRAYRIAQLLHARSQYDASYFASMQLDTISPAELEFARDLVGRTSDGDAYASTAATLRELARWNGSFARDSRAATIVHALRQEMESDAPSLTWLLATLRRGAPNATTNADVHGALYDVGARAQAWGVAGAVNVDHPLAPLRFSFLNGDRLPGQGDEYTIRLQQPGFAQSFRAVWDAGDWNAGGIAIPSGESGAPGSPHYTDLTPAWIEGRLEPLPFGERAVRAAGRTRATLTPGQN